MIIEILRDKETKFKVINNETFFYTKIDKYKEFVISVKKIKFIN